MKATKIEGGIYAQFSEYCEEVRYAFLGGELNDCMKDHGYHPLVPHTIEFQLPEDFEPTRSHIDCLRAEIQKVRAESHAKVMKLEEQIGKLLALEHKQ